MDRETASYSEESQKIFSDQKNDRVERNESFQNNDPDCLSDTAQCGAANTTDGVFSYYTPVITNTLENESESPPAFSDQHFHDDPMRASVFIGRNQTASPHRRSRQSKLDYNFFGMCVISFVVRGLLYSKK